jgi:glycosidase
MLLAIADFYLSYGWLRLRNRKYTDVDPLFGSIADLDRLISAAHRNRLKIILDLVANHTSDQHPWFIESKALALVPDETAATEGGVLFGIGGGSNK